MRTRKVYTPTEESVAPDRCLWISRNHDQSIPTRTKLYPTLHHSQTRKPLQARTTCDTPERIFRTQALLQLAQDPHLLLGGQKRRKRVPSGSLDTLCIPMRRILYRRMPIRKSLSFRRHTLNEEGQQRRPWRDLPSIPTSHHPLHHRNVRQDFSDCHPGYPHSFVSFVLCFSNRASFGLPGKALPGGRWTHTINEVPCSARTLVFQSPPFFIEFSVVQQKCWC